ncbi:MAG: hypothetical protein ACK5LJ_05830, partial [Paracoccus sp. (in: a-proteobacteria)]
IALRQRDQDAAERLEYMTRPWLAPREWREEEARENVSDARDQVLLAEEDLMFAQGVLVFAQGVLDGAEDALVRSADPVPPPQLPGQLAMV